MPVLLLLFSSNVSLLSLRTPLLVPFFSLSRSMCVCVCIGVPVWGNGGSTSSELLLESTQRISRKERTAHNAHEEKGGKNKKAKSDKETVKKAQNKKGEDRRRSTAEVVRVVESGKSDAFDEQARKRTIAGVFFAGHPLTYTAAHSFSNRYPFTVGWCAPIIRHIHCYGALLW